MANNYTIFTSYLLTSLSGYSTAIHCNYINSVQFQADNPYTNNINLFFSGGSSDFKFLSTDITSGTGFTVNKLFILIQLVSGTTNVKPDASQWKIVEITGFTGIITPTQLTNKTFNISLLDYTGFTAYTLNNAIPGLLYPSALPGDDDKLCFGDEIYFFGNVTTQIHADVFTTNLSLIMNLGDFNSSTNSTWDGQSVFASEIGIYDTNMNLVAIGKFNDPVEKNGNISRTILFAIDF
jgi:hypothetical protein